MAGGEHSSRVYDQELENMRSRVLQMGGLVEAQIKMALDAFDSGDVATAEQAIAADRRVNELELELDKLVNHVIARRQPTAGDLRMIMGVAKTITDIERSGDEAAKIARAVIWLRDKDSAGRFNRIPDIRSSGEAALTMFRHALDAFARMDAGAAAATIREDQAVDDRFRAILRQLVTYMMEDPRAITPSIDTVWIAKAIERIGDHAKNIAEHVIFIAQGEDVRHSSPDEVERTVSRN
ncbi:MAG TPA: phosphate signaling complex protein PhoU [Burkholderiaceae bacterium]|jgi:phosphate transport system protein|nr:phosphate signaling complex protein PhoU [Burkholderiaceae bacterium]HRZ60971.1 phosphate signaling complex protein PhoU [Rubrivivax sp.]